MLDEIRDLLGPGGKFATLCDGYEHREQQVDMADAVADALARKDHLLVEAGTGVGKTVAYLTPAALFATGEKRPVVVSTHTINLQGQLVGKDIPLMQRVMDDHPFSAVLMKGRGNFLCLQELDHASALIYYQGHKDFDRLKEWAKQTETGDIGELDFAFQDWHEVCCNPDTCRHQECPYQAERCFYYKMRKRAAAADVIVVNHSLFFSDLALRKYDPKAAVIPNYGAVIFDEAHHLEDVASNTFGVEFSNYRVTSLINRLKKRRDLDISAGEFQQIQSTNDMLFDRFHEIRKQEFYFDDLYQIADKQHVEKLANDLVIQLDSLNTQLGAIDTMGDKEFKERIQGYRNIVGRMAGEMRDIFFAVDENYFRWAERPGGAGVSGFGSSDSPRAGRSPKSRNTVVCRLHWSPVCVADLLRDALWNSIDSVICTSATLSNSGTFCYLKGRLGAPDCNELILGSPFDFKTQALLYVPDDLDQPSEKTEYADAVSDRIRDILIAAGGRAFLLFTSYRMLNAVFDRLQGNAGVSGTERSGVPETKPPPASGGDRGGVGASTFPPPALGGDRGGVGASTFPPPALGGDRGGVGAPNARLPYRLLRQGEMSNERLIKEFREDESTCLMGVHSFWEGVDVKGERLSCVIIDKLPFSVPDTPTNKARCQQIEAEGGNWFTEYAIPQAQIKLKQGFGRLIRTKTDCGVVAILDSRIHHKYYGREFLKYLPHCPGTKKVEKIREFLGVEEVVDVDRFGVG